MQRLDRKVTIITGATSGMGRRTAERFVEEGARIVVCGRRAELGKSLEDALGTDWCHFIKADVTRESDVKGVIDACVSKWGRVDCLFNNAGAPIADNGIETISVEDFDWVINSVLRSAMLGMKHVAPIMMAQKSGSIINNGSIAGRQAGYSSSLAYGAAKAGVIHLTRCVAMQLGEHNVRVNSISPGAIPTGIFAKAFGVGADKADAAAGAVVAAFSKAQRVPRRISRRHCRSGRFPGFGSFVLQRAQCRTPLDSPASEPPRHARGFEDRRRVSVGQLSFECHFAMTQCGAQVSLQKNR